MVEGEKYSFFDELYSSIPDGWNEFFESDMTKCILSLAQEVLKTESRKIVPLPKNLFSAFWSVPPHSIKVVIFGQDPYPTVRSDGTPVADGLAFSCGDTTEVQSSLRNMYKEMQATSLKEGKDYPLPRSGELFYLCYQGVFLFNTVLTTVKGEAGAHAKKEGQFWDPFVSALLDYLFKINKNIIYLLLGGKAKKLKDKFLNENTLKVEAGHPSGLNTSTNFESKFIGSGCFSKVNEMLISLGEEPIEWIPQPEKF